MRKFSSVKYYGLALYILLLLAEVISSAPCPGNYESGDESDSVKGQEFQLKNRLLDIRDLYELLTKKHDYEDQFNPSHQIARKSNRSPSLRLRFGKRRDFIAANPRFTGHPPYSVGEDFDN